MPSWVPTMWWHAVCRSDPWMAHSLFFRQLERQMRRLLLTTTALLALSAVSARADVLLDTTGQGGTGNNVVFSGVDPNNSHQILGHLNGHNDQIVRFLDLSNTTGFSGAANGNDIKMRRHSQSGYYGLRQHQSSRTRYHARHLLPQSCSWATYCSVCQP